jgi:hypothetical protein
MPDLQHNLFLLSQSNQLFLSPAGKDKPLNRVLDAGTGTGIWAVEFGMFLDPTLRPGRLTISSRREPRSSRISLHAASVNEPDSADRRQVVGVDLSPIQPAL